MGEKERGQQRKKVELGYQIEAVRPEAYWGLCLMSNEVSRGFSGSLGRTGR